MQNESYCLGLDISSTVVGYCVSSSKEKIIDAVYVDIQKEKTTKNKAHKVAEYLDPRSIDPSDYNCRRFTKRFRWRKNNFQQTIVKLAKCNAVISYVIEALYEVDVDHVNVFNFS